MAVRTSMWETSGCHVFTTTMGTELFQMLPKSLASPAGVGALGRVGETTTEMGDSIYLFLVTPKSISAICRRVQPRQGSQAALVKTFASFAECLSCVGRADCPEKATPSIIKSLMAALKM